MRRARQVLVKETAAAVKQFDSANVQKTRLTRGPQEDQAAKLLKQGKTLPNTATVWLPCADILRTLRATVAWNFASMKEQEISVTCAWGGRGHTLSERRSL
jgi:hypothetical protein